jgi:biotin carboxylase
MNPQAPGAALADRFFVASTIDAEATTQVAEECRVDGVITLGTDFPVRTVAAVAQRLGLPGLSPATAASATDKHLMRKALSTGGVPCPAFRAVASSDEARAAAEEIGHPVIVKPTDRSGSVGVTFVQSPEEVPAAFERARSESRGGGVLVEGFAEGREISVETMCHAGRFSVVAVTDKLTTGVPFFVELGHCVPTTLSGSVLRHVHEVAHRASQALGIDRGPTHTEMKVGENGAVIIELGARLGGDRITSHLVPLATGVDLVAASIRVALGEAPDLTPGEARAASIRYVQAPPGKVTALEGVDAARQFPGVHDTGLDVEVGESLGPVRASGDRPGWVIAVGPTPAEAVRRAEAARDMIQVITAPEGD